MSNTVSLQRFVDAQKTIYPYALSEIKAGRKQTHWMWYIFPQIAGLGFSSTSRFYAIKDTVEANLYQAHPLLYSRLVEISKAVLDLKDKNAKQIFGSPDDLKLKSCMTLFSTLQKADPVFKAVLDKYFNGNKDEQTLKLIQQ